MTTPSIGSRILDIEGNDGYGVIVNTTIQYDKSVANTLYTVDFGNDLHADRYLTGLRVLPDRITGEFIKQYWGGFQNDEAIEIGTVEFDATNYVLRMSLSDIQVLDDADDTSDAVGLAHVDHDGPYSVYLNDPICKYFGVEHPDDITPDMLDQALSQWEERALPVDKATREQLVDVLTEHFIHDRMQYLKEDPRELEPFLERLVKNGWPEKGLEIMDLSALRDQAVSCGDEIEF